MNKTKQIKETFKEIKRKKEKNKCPRLNPYILKIYIYIVEIKGIDEGLKNLREVMKHYKSNNYSVWEPIWNAMFEKDDTGQARLIYKKNKATKNIIFLNKKHPETQEWQKPLLLAYVKKNNYFLEQTSNKHNNIVDFMKIILFDLLNEDNDLIEFYDQEINENEEKIINKYLPKMKTLNNENKKAIMREKRGKTSSKEKKIYVEKTISEVKKIKKILNIKDKNQPKYKKNKKSVLL